MTSIFKIDLETLLEQETYTLHLTHEVCQESAQRFKIPHIYNINIDMRLDTQTHSWLLTGHVAAKVQLQCAQSNELFDENFNIPFEVVLSQYEVEDDTLDIEIIPDLKVDAGDIALQYLALHIPLHPAHPSLSSDTPTLKDLSSQSSSTTWKKALEQLKQQNSTPRN